MASRGLRLVDVDADAEDAGRLAPRVYLAAELVGAARRVDESSYAPRASVQLKLRALLRRLVGKEEGVVPAAVRILERDGELHAGSIAR